MKSMKKVLGVVLTCTLLLTTLLVYSGSAAGAESYAGYIMGYFTDAQYGLNLAYSTNGRNWTALNGGKAVMIPTIGQKGMRDPFIKRKQDGTFAIVATDMRGTNWSDHSQYVQYYDSTDLCTFNNARLLKVHNTDMHSWAPEVFYDYTNSRYGIIWSGNTDRNRTYVNYTTDFKTVTSNQVFFDPGYDVIDSDVIQHNGTAYLFFKDERSGQKRIKAAKSSTCQPGSFSVFTPNFLTSANSEGPFVFKSNYSESWFMYDDLFAQNGIFECWNTSDLNATSWTKVTDISLPSGVRHGSVVSVTQAELDKIRAKWK